jgi:hypothetical protein
MLLSKRPSNKVILLLGIQSSIVRSTLVLLEEGKPPCLKYIETYNITYQAHTGTSRLIKSTLKTLREAVDAATKYLHAESHNQPGAGIPKKVSEVHYILSSPWIVSKARTITEKFPKPVIVSRNLIMNIISEARKKDDTSDSPDIEVIEEKIFDVHLNGYSVEEWEGKSTSELSISFAVSVAGTVMIEKFREICRHIVHSGSVHFHSALLLEYIGLHIIRPNQNDYILIHAHGELTDVVVVDRGMAVFFASFPRGVNTIIRSLGNALDVAPTVAESMLNLHKEANSDKHNDKTAGIIQNMADGWIGELAKLYKNAAYTRALPKTAIVSARSHEDFFRDIYKDSHPAANIETLSTDDVKNLIIYGKSIPDMPLVGLYTVALLQMGHGK